MSEFSEWTAILGAQQDCIWARQRVPFRFRERPFAGANVDASRTVFALWQRRRPKERRMRLQPHPQPLCRTRHSRRAELCAHVIMGVAPSATVARQVAESQIMTLS